MNLMKWAKKEKIALMTILEPKMLKTKLLKKAKSKTLTMNNIQNGEGFNSINQYETQNKIMNLYIKNDGIYIKDIINNKYYTFKLVIHESNLI